MRALIVSPITDKSDMWLLGDDELIYHIKEGTGDALEQEDIDDGYVDYIYIDIYKNDLNDIYEDNIFDGGFILLKKLYKDMSIEDILATVEEFHDVRFFSMEDDEWDKMHAQVMEGVSGA